MTDTLATEDDLEEWYETILMNIRDAVYTLGAEGRITWVNRPAVENYDIGYGRDELIGAHVSKVLDQKDINKAAEIIQSLLEDDDREKGRCEIVVHTAHGQEIPCDLHLSLLPFDDGEFQGTIGVLRDIRERKQREQRLAVFNRVLRHNVRNEMTVILGLAEDLQRTIDGAAAEKAAVIRDRGERLNSLAEKARKIEEILEGQESVLQPVNVQEIVRDRVEVFETEHTGVTITFDEHEERWATANEMLGHAIDELLENAIEHNEEPIQISVSIVPGVDERHWVEITVEDNGSGLPMDEITAIEGGEETQLQHANGLGLWFVNWLVNLFGGSLSFEHLDSGGSSVTISLQRASAVE